MLRAAATGVSRGDVVLRQRGLSYFLCNFVRDYNYLTAYFNRAL